MQTFHQIIFGLFYYDVTIWLIDSKFLQKIFNQGAYR